MIFCIIVVSIFAIFYFLNSGCLKQLGCLVLVFFISLMYICCYAYNLYQINAVNQNVKTGNVVEIHSPPDTIYISLDKVTEQRQIFEKIEKKYREQERDPIKYGTNSGQIASDRNDEIRRNENDQKMKRMMENQENGLYSFELSKGTRVKILEISNVEGKKYAKITLVDPILKERQGRSAWISLDCLYDNSSRGDFGVYFAIIIIIGITCIFIKIYSFLRESNNNQVASSIYPDMINSKIEKDEQLNSNQVANPVLSSVVNKRIKTDEQLNNKNKNLIKINRNTICELEIKKDEQLNSNQVANPMFSSVVNKKTKTDEQSSHKNKKSIAINRNTIRELELETDEQLNNNQVANPILSSMVDKKIGADEQSNHKYKKSIEINRNTIRELKQKGFRICPKCHSPIKKNVDICSRCGYIFTSNKNRGKKTRKIKCPICQRTMKDGDSFCPYCNCPIERNEI